MNGTEKQIKWAEDIKADSAKAIANIEKFIKESDGMIDEMRDVALNALAKAQTEATFWIDAREILGQHSSEFDIEEDKINGLKMAANKCSKFLEDHIAKYI